MKDNTAGNTPPRRRLRILREDVPAPDTAAPSCALERELCTLLLAVVRSMARRGVRFAVARTDIADGITAELALRRDLSPEAKKEAQS
jgi:hypothetical protein